MKKEEKILMLAKKIMVLLQLMKLLEMVLTKFS